MQEKQEIIEQEIYWSQEEAKRFFEAFQRHNSDWAKVMSASLMTLGLPLFTLDRCCISSFSKFMRFNITGRWSGAQQESRRM